MRSILFLLVFCSTLTGCISLDTPSLAALGGIYYYTKDGFTWQVEDQAISSDRYRITIKKGHLMTSGDGEALQIFKQHADMIAEEHDCSGYQILQYSEGIESGVLKTQRVAQGLIQCTPMGKDAMQS